VALLDVSSRFEEKILTAWINRHRPPDADIELLRVAPSRRRRRLWRTDPRLRARLQRGDDPWLLPLRVAWLPFVRHGRRIVHLIDVIKLGDPRDPDALRQRAILRSFPDRVVPVVGSPAPVSRLIADHERSGEVVELERFVVRRAWRTLDRAERALRGNRYKVPKFLHEELSSRSEFQDGAVIHGGRRGLSPAASLARARHYLREMAASHSPLLIDLIAGSIHWLYRQGYEALVYDRDRVAELAALGQEYPLVFLPSHRSNLDRLSLQFLLWENDLPPNHTAGGINMNFFPVGPLIRRTGVFFIRRSFKDNPLYKFVLRSYIDYLVDNRFSMEWYMEGGRSRSGKLAPPRYGLLAYIVESQRKGKAEDVMLVPVSIAYDQIQDLSSYTNEALGGAKSTESLGWMVTAVRSLRKRYGKIHVRFADPISVRKELAGAEATDEGSRDLAKVAFEVMYRISRVTPVTPAAVVSIALLEAKGTARTLPELTRICADLDAFIAKHGLPCTEPIQLEDPREVKRVLELLTEHGNVSQTSLPEPLYWLEPEQALRAAYYRNVVVHFFLPRAIAELALLAGHTVDVFWEEIARLRDLLKFEFYFPQKEQLRTEIEQSLMADAPGWETMIDRPEELLRQLRPRCAHWAVLPFLEAYLVMADELAQLQSPFEEASFLQACMRRGESYRRRGLIQSSESISQVLFRQSLLLANNRNLIEADQPARDAFAAEIRSVVDRALRAGAITPG
jgi:glycerol-3-phosphate O-acyltransferase